MKVSPASDGKYSISVLQDSKKTVKVTVTAFAMAASL